MGRQSQFNIQAEVDVPSATIYYYFFRGGERPQYVLLLTSPDEFTLYDGSAREILDQNSRATALKVLQDWYEGNNFARMWQGLQEQKCRFLLMEGVRDVYTQLQEIMVATVNSHTGLPAAEVRRAVVSALKLFLEDNRR